jgi:hypothetical protein
MCAYTHTRLPQDADNQVQMTRRAAGVHCTHTYIFCPSVLEIYTSTIDRLYRYMYTLSLSLCHASIVYTHTHKSLAGSLLAARSSRSMGGKINDRDQATPLSLSLVLAGSGVNRRKSSAQTPPLGICIVYYY